MSRPSDPVTPADEATVEAVARAIVRESDRDWDVNPDDPADVYMRDARAAITAYESARGDVKADRETVATIVHRARCACNVVTLMRADFTAADAILALWPGKTEREVKAKAYERGWFDRATYDQTDADEPRLDNPYRATAIENGATDAR